MLLETQPRIATSGKVRHSVPVAYCRWIAAELLLFCARQVCKL